MKIRYAPDSKSLAILSFNRPPSLWRVSDGERIASLEHEYGNAITFSLSGELFAQHLGGFDSTEKVAVRQTHNGALVRSFDAKGVEIVRFYPDGKKLMLKFNGGQLLDAGSGFILFDIFEGSSKRFEEKAFDIRDLLAVAPRSFGDTALRTLFGERLRVRYPRMFPRSGLSYLIIADKASVAVGASRKGEIKPHAFTFDPVTLKLNPPLALLSDEFSGPALSGDGRLLADRSGPVWDVTTGSRLWQLPKRFDELVFSSDGSRLFGVVRHVTKDGRSAIGATIVAYDALSGKELAALVPDSDDLPVRNSDKEPSLRLLHVDAEGRRAIARSGHAAYVWDIDQKKSRRLDGTYKVDREKWDSHRKALAGAPLERLLVLARELFTDCPAAGR